MVSLNHVRTQFAIQSQAMRYRYHRFGLSAYCVRHRSRQANFAINNVRIWGLNESNLYVDVKWLKGGFKLSFLL